MRVLIVDDAELLRKMLRLTLEAEGFTCEEAANGLDAVADYQAWRPDVVILDYYMPAMDGLTALREIKRFDPRARIIMCSVTGNVDTIDAALAAGAHDFILKPFPQARLVESIKKLPATKRATTSSLG